MLSIVKADDDVKTEKKFITRKSRQKQQNIELSVKLPQKKERLQRCSDWIGIAHIDDRVKQTYGEHCGVRLCPVCAKREEMKIRAKLFQMLPELQKRGYAYIYAVFTVKNCAIAELRNTIKLINKAFDRLYKRKELKHFKGYFRTLEVTRNQETNEAHPHANVIFAVNKRYFTTEEYINKATWVDLWKECLRVDYEPNVWVKRIQLVESDLLEVLKYSVKTTDMLAASHEWLVMLDKQMKGVRLTAAGGVFKELLLAVTKAYGEREVTDEEDYSQTTSKYFHFEGTQYEHCAHPSDSDVSTRKNKQSKQGAVYVKRDS